MLILLFSSSCVRSRETFFWWETFSYKRSFFSVVSCIFFCLGFSLGLSPFPHFALFPCVQCVTSLLCMLMANRVCLYTREHIMSRLRATYNGYVSRIHIYVIHSDVRWCKNHKRNIISKNWIMLADMAGWMFLVVLGEIEWGGGGGSSGSCDVVAVVLSLSQLIVASCFVAVAASIRLALTACSSNSAADMNVIIARSSS